MKEMKEFESSPSLLQRLSYHYQHHFNQVLAVAGATITLFATGNIMGFSSVTIPELLSPESSIKVDHEDLSWIASLVTIGGFFGTLSGGPFADLLGRKRTIMMSSLIFFIGWLSIAFATNVMNILVGRLLTGIASGMYSASVQVYICEIVDPSIRGVSGALPTLMVSIGVLAMYITGSVSHWRTLAFLSSTFPIFVLFYMFFLPESPVWLLSKGKVTAAINSLTWLRNDYDEAEDEIYKLQLAAKERRISTGCTTTTTSSGTKRKVTFNRQKIYTCCSRFSERAVLQPLGIGLALFFFQKFCGVSAITFYATLIFQYADNMNNYTETIIVGCVRIISNLIGIFLIKFFKRKPLLITSALIMCLSNGALGIYFYAKDKYGEFGGNSKNIDDIFYGGHQNTTTAVMMNLTNTMINATMAATTSTTTTTTAATTILTSTMSSVLSNGSIIAAVESSGSEIIHSVYAYSIECIPLICVTVFMLGSSVGFAVIPWFLVAELLPADVRSLSCSLAYGFCQLCQFTSIKTFLNMLDTFGTYGTFWIYALIALCGALFVLLFVPETSNMHSADIEKLFESSTSNSSCSASTSSGFNSSCDEHEDDELTPLKHSIVTAGPSNTNHNSARKSSLIEIIQNSNNYTVVRFDGENNSDDDDTDTGHSRYV